jgi:hypothetical protein
MIPKIAPVETETAPVELKETVLTLSKPCKHSNRFDTQDPDAPITSIYVLKGNMPEIKNAKKIAVTIRVVE